MIDTIAKAQAYGRLQTAIHRLYEAVANMDEGAIRDIARRVEVVADSCDAKHADLFDGYDVGTEVEVDNLYGRWLPGRVVERYMSGGVPTVTVEVTNYADRFFDRNVGECALRKVSR